VRFIVSELAIVPAVRRIPEADVRLIPEVVCRTRRVLAPTAAIFRSVSTDKIVCRREQ